MPQLAILLTPTCSAFESHSDECAPATSGETRRIPGRVDATEDVSNPTCTYGSGKLKSRLDHGILKSPVQYPSSLKFQAMESQVDIDMKPLSQNKNEKKSRDSEEERTESRTKNCIKIAVLGLAFVLLLGLVSLIGVIMTINEYEVSLYASTIQLN